jgi:hypothetical protein
MMRKVRAAPTDPLCRSVGTPLAMAGSMDEVLVE